MIRRICPNCRAERYSAYTGAWTCDVCGAVVLDKHTVPLENREDGKDGTEDEICRL